MSGLDLTTRAQRHGALADPVRLAIVDELARSDRSPAELARLLGIGSNLLAHHLDVLERVGMIERSRSSGDGRRRYVHLLAGTLQGLSPAFVAERGRALFVCTRNSARSQLAAAMWRSLTGTSAESAGTEPAASVHPHAVDAARRSGLGALAERPRSLDELTDMPFLVITVCDRAHEDLRPPTTWLHWSVADPVIEGTAEAFDATVAELRDRMARLVEANGVSK